MKAGEHLCTEIRSYLDAPPPPEPWQQCWEAARYLFLLHPYINDDTIHTQSLQDQLHVRIDDVRDAMEEMALKTWMKQIQKTFATLHHQFEQMIGNRTAAPIQTLHSIQRLQKELDALQWMTSDLRGEDDFAIAEAFVDLGLIEREVRILKGLVKRSEKKKNVECPIQSPHKLEALNAQMVYLRTELLERESTYYLYSTQKLVPDIRFQSSSSYTHRSRASRTGSIPKHLSSSNPSEYLELLKEENKEERPSSKLASVDELNTYWDALLQAEGLLLAIHMESTKHPEHSSILEEQEADLERHRQRLKEHINQLVQQLPEAQQRNWFAQHLLGIIDEVDEALAALDEQPMEEAILNLKHLQMQMVWLRRLVLPLREKKDTIHAEFAQALKQFQRMERRLQAETQEKKLQFKLEQKFGHRAVALSENIILVLIFLVVGLLTIEYAMKLTPQVKTILIWVDTAICFVFLTEFFTKLYYAENKSLYFRRHFLIDFLPSVPFALIFSLFQGPVVSIAAGRAARLARISRMTRYIRILRPMIRVFRVLIFLMRALDRLVRRYETVFNRNVILFPDPNHQRQTTHLSIQSEIQGLRERCRKRMRMLLNSMEPDARLCYIQERTQEIINQLSGHDGSSRAQGLLQKNNDAVYFDDLVEKMVNIDEIEVEELLGERFIHQMSRIFRVLAAPGVRSLPLIRGLAKAYMDLAPAALVAWLIQGIGRFLERIQRIIHWVGDLYGIVTGPQVLDRIGLTLINATMRPARRLLLFGFLFIFFTLFIQAFSIGWFKDAAKFLAKFLGTPIIVLGALSLIPLTLGFWFRMIAGETTDFFARISEAQFIARLKQIKQHKASFDLRHLVLRVLQPEAVLRQQSITDPEQLITQLKEQLGQRGEFSLRELSRHASSVDIPETHPLLASSEQTIEDHPTELKSTWSERDRIVLLYEDYLDGTPLHRSDTKTTNHLLGNITIQNIRKHRLGLSLVQNLRIEKLDLSRPRLLLYFGPYLWFSSITESLTHRIARLIVEYNQNCIPRRELDWYPEEERTLFEDWITHREERLEGIPQQQERQKKDQKEFRTTEFTALHFLSAEPERDRSIQRSFGTRVARLMQEERKLLMRELFGYYPFHLMAKEHKTFNIYQSYQKHVSGGRFLLLPFKMIGWFFQSIIWGILRIKTLVTDILRPPSHVETQVKGKADFSIAIRKINRMRKPLYIECMRLRAAFDIEYLGFYLPGHEQSGLEGNTYVTDLDFIGASKRETLEFEQLQETREQQILLFDHFLERQQWKGEQWIQKLHDIHPALAEKQGEVLRAMTSAFAADYKNVRTLLDAEHHINILLNAEEHSDFPHPSPSFWRSIGFRMSRMFKTLFYVRQDKELEWFECAWERLGHGHRTPEEKQRHWELFLTYSSTFTSHLKCVASLEQTPSENVADVLEHVMRHSSIWTEELLTLRTLQTLTQLDIQLYRELVHTMGAYD